MGNPRLVFTGNGRAGSWFIRGEQIGNALGATVDPAANAQTFRAHDLAVVVKRVPDERLRALREAGTPWVWDIVDAFPQPLANGWEKDEAIGWARAELKRLQPSAVVWPTKKMQQDVGFDGPQAVIYHHHRPEIRRNPLRQHVQAIGYEGRPLYIEPWRAHLEAECDKRGWRFVVNPPQLADVDIVVALRGGRWGGYVSDNWKSNVKLANAHGSGTPFVGSPEYGYVETSSGAEYWADSLGSLRMSLDWLSDIRTREVVSDRFIQRAYPLDKAATAYRDFLCALKF